MRAFVKPSKDQRLPNIGELRHRIIVARRERESEDDTRFRETLVVVGRYWSRITNLEGVSWSGGASDQQEPWPTHEFLIRRAPHFENEFFDKCYVIYKGHRYRLASLWDYDWQYRFLGLIAVVEQREGNAPVQNWTLMAEDGTVLIGE